MKLTTVLNTIFDLDKIHHSFPDIQNFDSHLKKVVNLLTKRKQKKKIIIIQAQ